MAAGASPVLPKLARGVVALAAILPALASFAFAAEPEPADAPLPELSAKDLAEKIRAARERYAGGLLEVQFEEEQNQNPQADGRTVKSAGSMRFVGDGRRWRVDLETGPDDDRTRLSSGFDGSMPFVWNRVRNRVTVGEADYQALGDSPRALFWYETDSLLKDMEKPTTTIGRRTVDGHACYVVTTRGGDWSADTVISPRQGYLPVRQSWLRRGQMTLTYNFRDVREASPGVWVPGQIFALHRFGAQPGKEPRLMSRRVSRVVRYEPGKTFDDSAFRLDIPVGVDVTDHRLGYSYHSDAWWPEIGTLLRDRFDWPRAHLSSLSRLATYSGAKLEGKPAPPLRAAAWLDGRPLDWEQLRGKVTLVHFWTAHAPRGGPELAAVRRVYEAYHRAGFEVIAVHTPTDDAESVRRFAREYRLPFPIALDAPGGESGATAAAFGVDDRPCSFLVDHEGRVHELARNSRDGTAHLNALEDLLRKAGAGLLPPLGVENELSQAMIVVLRDDFPRIIAAAPATGRIAGTIRDGEGRPIARAKVQATMSVRILMHGIPGGYFSFPGPGSSATTGPDGRFELTGLRKGRYDLVFTAQNKAAVEERADIAADLAPATADAVLDQGDAIEGVIVDEDDRPVAGARLEYRERRYQSAESTWRMGMAGVAAVADAEGRFRVAKLHRGDYLFEVTAKGFDKRTLDWIPAGSDSETIVLKRAKPK